MTAPGPLALVGSGEFLPGMRDVDRSLLEGRAPAVAVLSTAAVPDGPATVQRWHAMAVSHYEVLGAHAVPVPVADRASADDPANAALVDGVGLVYLSGGDPTFLAQTLRGTAVWAAIERAWRSGAAVAGCSAGAMAMGALAFSPRGIDRTVPGLGLVPPVAVLPHFDRLVTWQPELLGRAVERAPDGVHVVGVDEDTALVWRPDAGWTARGRGRVVVPSAADRPFTDGEAVPLPDPTGQG